MGRKERDAAKKAQADKKAAKGGATTPHPHPCAGCRPYHNPITTRVSEENYDIFASLLKHGAVVPRDTSGPSRRHEYKQAKVHDWCTIPTLSIQLVFLLFASHSPGALARPPIACTGKVVKEEVVEAKITKADILTKVSYAAQ